MLFLVKHVDLQQCVPESDQPQKGPHLSAKWVTMYKKHLMLSIYEQNQDLLLTCFCPDRWRPQILHLHRLGEGKKGGKCWGRGVGGGGGG